MCTVSLSYCAGLGQQTSQPGIQLGGGQTAQQQQQGLGLQTGGLQGGLKLGQTGGDINEDVCIVHVTRDVCYLFSHSWWAPIREHSPTTTVWGKARFTGYSHLR